MQTHRKSSGDTVPPLLPLSQQFVEPVTQLACGREKLKATLQKISTRDNNHSMTALDKNNWKIGISIETLEHATNQLEKDVTEVLAQRK